MAEGQSQRKFLTGFTIVALLSIISISQVAIYKSEYAESLGYYRSLARAQLEKNHLYLENQISRLKSDLTFISDTPPFQGIIRSSRNSGIDPLDGSTVTQWKERLSTIFMSYLKANPEVIQLRYIELANNGPELVRVDRNSNGVFPVRTQDLQQKGSRSYVKESINLQPEEFYISRINLNRENGVVQKPYMPMLRVAKPVFDASNNIFGIIIINYDFRQIIDYLNKTKIDWDELYMLNQSGDFVIHPDETKRFGFDKQSRYTWDDEFSVEEAIDFTRANSFKIKINRESFYIETIPQSIRGSAAGTLDLTYAIKFPQAIITKRAIDNTFVTILSIFMGLVLIGFISFLIMRNMRQGEEVSRQQSRLAAIVDGAHEAIISEDLEEKITDWNRGAERIFGLTKKEVIGKKFSELALLNDGSKLDFIDQNENFGEKGKKQELTFLHPDGRKITAAVYSSRIWGGVGEMIGTARLIHDISKRKAMENELRLLNEDLENKVAERTNAIDQYQQFQSAILDSSSGLIISTNVEGIIIQMNPAAERALGFAPDDVINKVSVLNLLDPTEVKKHATRTSLEIGRELKAGTQSLFARVVLDEIEEGEWHLLPKSKTPIPVYLCISAIKGANGEVSGYVINATDITEVNKSKAQIELAQSRLVAAAQLAGMGIWEWDVASGALTWDDMMFDIYRLPIRKRFEGVAYKDWYQAVHPDDIEMASNSLSAAVEGKGEYDVTFRVIRPNTQIRYVKAGGVIERDVSGAAIRVVGFNLDITQQVEHEKLLEEAIEKTRKANVAKSEFLANMSHEIRTPMNAVLGTIQLLQHTPMTSQQVDYVAKTEVAAKSLLNIINDILDFSKIEAGKLELDVHDTSLEKLLSNIGNITASNVGEKKIDLILDIESNVPRIISADSHRLQQVLINLVSNSIKFTNHGEVRLEVSSETIDSTHYIRFSVFDTGIGISTEHQEKIFNAFSQAESSTSRNFGGTGLGLTISSRLVSLMGGELNCESSPGAGSLFSFSIPFQPGKTKAREVEIPKSLNMLKVLVVEDNQYVRALLKRILKSFGWTVYFVESGDAAINEIDHFVNGKSQLIDVGKLDVILIDWDLPDLCGWPLIEAIRSHLGEYRIPLVPMVTANERAILADKGRAKKSLINGFLQKPLTPSQILNAVADAVSKESSEHKFVSKQTNSRLDGIKILLVEDNPTNQQVGQSLLCTQGAEVICANDGDEAVSLLREKPNEFELVLMDIQMPVKDGYTATKEIRHNIGLEDLPIIAMTANVMASDVEQAKAAGMDAHIGKPFEIESLVELIERFIATNANGSKREYVKDNKVGIETRVKDSSIVSATETLNTKLALKRMQNNLSVYESALKTFLVDSQSVISQLDHHWPTTTETHRMLAHTLKGMSGSIGAEKLSDAARILEECLIKGDSLRFNQLRELLEKEFLNVLKEIRNYLSFLSGPDESTIEELDDDELISDLESLKARLRGADLQALDYAKQLRKRLSSQDSEMLSPLLDQVEALRFDGALREFERLKSKSQKFNRLFQ